MANVTKREIAVELIGLLEEANQRHSALDMRAAHILRMRILYLIFGKQFARAEDLGTLECSRFEGRYNVFLAAVEASEECMECCDKGPRDHDVNDFHDDISSTIQKLILTEEVPEGD